VNSPFEAFRAYRDGWDGYGAEAPSAISLDAAGAFYALLPQGAQDASRPGVHAAGHAMIEIRRDPAYAVFEFVRHDRVQAFVDAPGAEIEADLPFDGAAIPEEILDVVSGVFP
jgi:hypothetical protein